MATVASVSYTFPLECPDCKASSGYPFMAATKSGTLTAVVLAMRCRDCRHEWPLELETQKIAFPASK
jgi:hypothetical protein